MNHVLTGDQAGADREVVDALTRRLELVYVEMDPGDALFFHANTLHRSDRNTSLRLTRNARCAVSPSAIQYPDHAREKSAPNFDRNRNANQTAESSSHAFTNRRTSSNSNTPRWGAYNPSK